MRIVVPVIVVPLLPAIAQAHGMSKSERTALLEGRNLTFVWMGATHMHTGYDHLLFLFGVVFFLSKFREIVIIVTAFTIDHGITLRVATLAEFTFNKRLIEAVIAISVAYIGFSNLGGIEKHLGFRRPNLLAMVFGFGLFHGLGLSTRLQKLKLPEEGLIERIVSFNVGIELGQVAALLAMFAALAFWRARKLFKALSRIANFGLVGAKALLLVVHLHAFQHNRNPNSFSFAEGLLVHAHENMTPLGATTE